MIDWQNIVVALILVSTGIYIGRRGWSRVRSMVRTETMNKSSCAGGGCAGCGSPTARQTSTANRRQEKTFDIQAHRLKWRC
jgi:hypothetical protein